MNDILTLEDLSNYIMTKHHISKEESDKFLDAFLCIIEEGLISDRYVRIKGFGTFKLIEDNINEKLSSNKIVFVPDSILKDAVNKPFSHFESIILNENVHFDDIEEFVLPEQTVIEKDLDEDNLGYQESSNNQVCQDNNNQIIDNDTFNIQKGNDVKNECNNELNNVIENDNSFEGENISAYYGNKHKKSQWLLIVSVFLIGLVLGALVSWIIYRKSVNFNDIREENVTPMTPEIVYSDTTLNADTIEGIEKNNVVDEEKIDSILISADIAKREKAMVKTEFLSEKQRYRIIGTIETYTIEKGNTLAKVAYKYYKNKKMWPYIVMHNKQIIKDPNNVPIGTVINIPELKTVE